MPLTVFHQVLPLSLGREPLNNAQFLTYFTPIMPAFTNFNLSSNNIVVDEEAKKAVVHASSTAKEPIQNTTTILNSFGSCNILLNSRRSVETNSVCSAHSRCRTNSREAPRTLRLLEALLISFFRVTIHHHTQPKDSLCVDTVHG